MLTVVTAGKAAPGASTLTWALTMGWPGPVATVDADPEGGDMAPGLLLGRAALDRGLLSWSSATRRSSPAEAEAAFAEHAVALPEAPHAWLMPGLRDATQAPAVTTGGGWGRVSAALNRLAGRDVLVDTGRLGGASCWPVICGADRVLLTCRGSGRSVHASTAAAALLRSHLGDLDRVCVVMVRGSGPYAPSEVAAELGIPLLGAVPDDPDTAAVLSDGAAAGVRGLRRTRLVRAAAAIARQLTDTRHLTPAAAP